MAEYRVSIYYIVIWAVNQIHYILRHLRAKMIKKLA